ncbi:MAG TPA: P-II family nitrogen regulator [Dehalococcoidia bacterium]|nr:P-II family nitrogen regulator [Dehalococcoidia bacterium]
MQKIEAIVRPEKLDDVKNALAAAGISGLNIVHVTGRGVQKGIVHMGRGGESYEVDMLPKVKVEVVVGDDQVDRLVSTICQAAKTGRIGDGKIFVLPVADAIRVRTGERGDAAL